MPQRWITGWKLDDPERTTLLRRFPPLFPDIIADHVTLRTGTDETTPLPDETNGLIVGQTYDGAGVQALVVSIGGTTIRADGGTYHITWSLDLAAGRRAVESNAVIARTGWRPLPTPLLIRLRPARF